MDIHKFLVFLKSCYVIIILVYFSNLVNETQSVYVNSSSCMARNCSNGGLDIRYPFWIQGFQESSCGLPGYNITCHDKNPILRISGDDYIIKDIFYANNSLLLAKAEVFGDENKCPSPRYNFSVEGTPFSYGPETIDLFFFYNCTSPYDRETYAVDCASNGSHHYAFAVFHPELLEHYNYSVESCLPPVNTPVHTDNLKRLLNMTYKDVLKKGFVLRWGGVDCSNCHGRGSELNVPRKIAIGIGAAAFGAIVMWIIFYMYHRRLKKRHSTSSMVSRDIFSYPTSVADLEKAGNYYGVHVFNYDELEEATNNFDSNKELGDGGFGTVYKGKLRDGRVVAIKRLYENNYKRVEQFMNEVEILTLLRHKNLVTLYGCTSYRGLVLVYEYIPNGTVADHLHGERAKPGLPSWTTRLNIAIETASALAYLHASGVIHRDVKTNNILLDANFSVKVADFGLSRLFPANATHVSTAPQGTPGYVDPEYHQYYHLTDRSDVYSFGVVLIELISSKPAVDITRHRHEINLSNMAVNKIQSHALHELVDPCLGFESDSKVKTMITAVAELAFQCLQLGREMRPSMQEVLEVLQGIQSNNSIIKAEEMDIPADDVLLLKNDALACSPDSETVSCRSAIPYASG